MLFNNLVKSATLAASLAAAAPAHVHNQHKRNIVYVTETNIVVVTANAPQTIAGADTTLTLDTLNTASSASFAPASAYIREAQGTAAAVAVVDNEDVAATTEATTTEAAATTATEAAATTAAETEATTSTTSVSSAAATTTASSGSTPQGKGITYSPYTSSGQCKTLAEVKSDLEKLTSYEIIRLYGVDCSQVEFVLQAKTSSQKLFLGIYFMDAIDAGISELASAISSYGSWDDVITVAIGNELVNSGEASVSQVASYVATGRSALTAAGYTGPVVSVDTHVATINNPGLCDISDYIAINAHAYFDYNTVAADAGSWLLLQIQRVWSACGGNKKVYVTESGWPHQGDTYGVAIASPAAQSAAISSIVSTVGDDVILFTAFDDLWKADGAQHCEKYWGFIN
ncbi:hypothetical protein WICPIJ_001468 [Wickerhamomyces pijperi]|uniref:Glycoside hydrolase family 17 protein n=1 Tax=Wickerhamomyces pijperi TaxID=599730 RepID=A0A9P8TR38_WICPI|nr:hypothetical protein WICPIJ_001468 [Wickerhamomyces pijperi]